MQRDKEPSLIKDVLERYLSKNASIKYGIKVRETLHLWERIADEYTGRHTKAVTIRDRILFVNTDSNVLANELALKEREFLHKINSALDMCLIDRIVFKSGLVRKDERKKGGRTVPKEELTVETAKAIDEVLRDVKEEDLKAVLRRFLRSMAGREKNT